MPETGQEGSAGPIVTAGGLVFISGTNDKKLKAFDKSTGKLVWKPPFRALPTQPPAPTLSGNKQYVAVSVGGNKENPAGSIMAFALPK
jgi:quinoprotein glucose dehydrogenase